MRISTRRILCLALALITVFSAAAISAGAKVTSNFPNTTPKQISISGAVSGKQGTDSANLGIVQNIKAQSYYTDKISLSWSALDGAMGYNVYYKSLDTAGAKLALLTSTKSTSVTMNNLTAGSKWEFEICGYTIVNGVVCEGETTVYQTGTKPEDVPGMWLTRASQHIWFRWTRVSKADGYYIYRKDSSSGFKKIKDFTASDTEFEDTGSSVGNTYTYRVEAYINVGGQTLTGGYNELIAVDGLCAPGNRGSMSMISKAYLRWSENDYADGYEIQHSSDQKTYTTLVSTYKTFYNTPRFNNGTHYFRIIPYAVRNGKKVYGTYTKMSLYISDTAYGEYVGTTYVAICIESQYMWYYKNNNLVVSTSVVTGNYNSMDTPKGYHSVQSKASPCTLVGDGYVSYVDYWIAFIGSGYGIHDASWRSEFGGEIYKGNGSHGCVNTPYNAVQTIYNNISVGTPVIVY